MATIRRLPRRHFLGATASSFVLARFGAGCAPGAGLDDPGAGGGAGTGGGVVGGPPAVADAGAVARGPDVSPAVDDVGVEVGSGPDVSLPSSELADPLPPLISNEDFYVVSVGGVPPEGWDADWTLTLSGLGDDLQLDLAAIQALGSETVEHTLECIGNGPPGNALSNAEWTGIRFRDLLEALDLTVPEESNWLAFECGDGYTTFLPLDDQALDLVLVWQMNGEPLPPAHGAPLRALVPGRYGMKNPKWISSISFTVEQPGGFWEAYGWSAEARYRVHSWVNEPDKNDAVPVDGVTLLGSAHAGAVPIARVEISTDDGETWEDAELTYVGPPNAWSLWRYHWVPGAPGTYTIVARATDVDGRLQGPSDGTGNLAGWQGQHTLEVEAV